MQPGFFCAIIFRRICKNLHVLISVDLVENFTSEKQHDYSGKTT